MNDLVSIIIPTYNREQYILDALDSIKVQTYKNFECIVVDDGDSETTANLLSEYQSKDNRFKYHRRPENWPKGANACRNYGLQMSRGDFIGFCDDDDFWLDDKLEKQMRVFRENPQYGLVTGNIEFVNEDGKRTGRVIKQLSKKGNVFKEFLLKNKMSMITPLLKREVFDMVGVFNPEFHLYEDWEYWRRASFMFQFYSLPDVLACVRRHSTNTYEINSMNPKREYLLYRRLNKSLINWGKSRFSKKDRKLITQIEGQRINQLLRNHCIGVSGKLKFLIEIFISSPSAFFILIKSLIIYKNDYKFK